MQSDWGVYQKNNASDNDHFSASLTELFWLPDHMQPATKPNLLQNAINVQG